jgi:hypothetical protein
VTAGELVKAGRAQKAEAVVTFDPEIIGCVPPRVCSPIDATAAAVTDLAVMTTDMPSPDEADRGRESLGATVRASSEDGERPAKPVKLATHAISSKSRANGW